VGTSLLGIGDGDDADAMAYMIYKEMMFLVFWGCELGVGDG
jgi:hypothetical protein